MSLISTLKGWVGEVQGTLAKKFFLDPAIYTDINNITIPTSNGTTQIDHVVVSEFGIFVVETKNFQGWIFGTEGEAQWIQSLPGGKKFKFQNPLRQNYRHIEALSEFLGLPEDKFHSVVMFWGESEFKTPMPENVMDKRYATYFKSKTVPMFKPEEVAQIVAAIKTGILPKTWATRNAHIDSLRERHASTTICPKCGKPLVLRAAKSGKNVGSQFYGCSGFPTCRYMKNIDV